ncbi:GIY-YIG nuclease family protein [Thiosulfativibrio zosterae]|uniref:GIY-YIG domain-containing protein n=1 Tax=Thiosulfativibrio zosterae TaxID=2675053 RepID=A0A6F8PND2_9GAMM|nr:GIY-YIG nuclease family protein [Thiosulfativibrio zosterae]BBP43558.1 hypothetical protein THMIRHAT_13040 [Thiosulfativibrio zosterae]
MTGISINNLENPNKTWFTYLLECADGTLYCGVTNDLVRRLKQHNGELVGGAKYTAVRRPVVLKKHWSQENRSSASQFEAQIKKMTRQQKLALLET